MRGAFPVEGGAFAFEGGVDPCGHVGRDGVGIRGGEPGEVVGGVVQGVEDRGGLGVGIHARPEQGRLPLVEDPRMQVGEQVDGPRGADEVAPPAALVGHRPSPYLLS